MSIWAIADLHLSFGTPNKSMEIFGHAWEKHADRVQKNWKAKIAPDDLVLIAGDISWAMKVEEAAADLAWIGKLPGTKVLVRGNHDYWWHSKKKVEAALPRSIHIVQNDAFLYRGVSIAGARLWDTPEYSFHKYVDYVEMGAGEPLTEEDRADKDEKGAIIFKRELARLELSLKKLDSNASMRLAMTHYPPIGPDLVPTHASQLLTKYGVEACVFGHLHSIKAGGLPFGVADGVRYLLSSCDYLGCDPIKVGELPI